MRTFHRFPVPAPADVWKGSYLFFTHGDGGVFPDLDLCAVGRAARKCRTGWQIKCTKTEQAFMLDPATGVAIFREQEVRCVWVSGDEMVKLEPAAQIKLCLLQMEDFHTGRPISLALPDVESETSGG